MQRHPMTPEGHATLEAELKQLKTVDRPRDIEGKLAAAQVIDPTQLPQEGRVVFGVTVVIENLDTEEEKRYKIVGDDEADFKSNKISINSPIARGLIGKSEGDDVKIVTPSGDVEYEIIEVIYEQFFKNYIPKSPINLINKAFLTL